MKSRQVIAAVERDYWSFISGSHDDGPFTFRYREDLCNARDFTGYSCMLEITWTFQHDGCTGLPSNDEMSQMEMFEDYLVEALEQDFAAVLAAVHTECGTREWTFYVSDIAECQRRINAMPKKPARYPIELIANTDPHWSCFHDKIQKISGKAARQ